MSKPESYQYTCPCCGQSVPKAIAVKSNGHFIFGACQQALFDAVKRCPDGISHDALRELVLKDGGSAHLVYVMINQINKKIRPWSLKIKSKGRLYRLEQLRD